VEIKAGNQAGSFFVGNPFEHFSHQYNEWQKKFEVYKKFTKNLKKILENISKEF